MIAEELLRAGRLDDALKALQEQVRSQPSNATLRIFLFQLLAVMGQWARAQNQLKVVGELDASALAPSDLRDLVWLPAELTLANGGATVALLPARYAETVEHGDDAARLGRKTEWLDSGLPVGQRLFVTDAGETALFDLRELDFEPRDA